MLYVDLYNCLVVKFLCIKFANGSSAVNWHLYVTGYSF